MSNAERGLSRLAGQVIGYRKDGRPIHLIAGGAPGDDEVTEPAEPVGRTFTKEEFDAAMTRERTKLYGRLEKTDEQRKAMEAEVKELRKAEAAREATEENRRKEAEAATKRAAEAEMSAKELIEERQREFDKRLAETQQSWQDQLKGVQGQLAERDAILEQERKLAALAAFAQRRVNEEQGSIADELIDYITGNSEAEIDASIELAKAKSAAIVQSIQNAQIQQRAAMPGVSSGGYTPTGPADLQGGTRTLSPEEIKALPMREYAKIRGQLGVQGSGANRGLFG